MKDHGTGFLFDRINPEPEPEAPPQAPPFDGATYDPVLDGPRLGRQLAAVSALMADGQWRTLADIAEAVREQSARASEAAVSARLRDLRKPKFGGFEVERRLIGNGLWEYRVLAQSRN